jgi:hypothetical protein
MGVCQSIHRGCFTTAAVVVLCWSCLGWVLELRDGGGLGHGVRVV